MPHNKPFHRNFRPLVPSPNSGYSSWAYIVDRDYAADPVHYIKSYLVIQRDLERILEYVEPCDRNLTTYSLRIHELLMRACIEVEANFKAIFSENKTHKRSEDLNMVDYRKVDVTHHLSSHEVQLAVRRDRTRLISPFSSWKMARGLDWYQAYNESKHDRHKSFERANFGSLIDAVAGLVILIASQFGNEDFSAGERLLSIGGHRYHDFDPTIGGLFTIKRPSDWTDAEKYDFDWQHLRQESVRFDKIGYDLIQAARATSP